MNTKAPFHHSVCKWCFGDLPLEAMAEKVKDMGITSIELVGVDDWAILKKHGLTCAIGNAPFISLTDGFNDINNHAKYQSMFPDLLKKAADAGIPNIIVFSGNRRGKSDVEGLENCAKGLDPIVKQAEKLGVNLVMELLNSKVDHPGHQCDRTAFGAAVVRGVDSPALRLLYDGYHMQLMEGDLMRTIRANIDLIGHVHTAGAPGRRDLDDRQEIQWPAIAGLLRHLGYQGWVGHEFIPRGDPVTALRAALIQFQDPMQSKGAA